MPQPDSMPQRGGRSSLPAPRKASTTWSRT